MQRGFKIWLFVLLITLQTSCLDLLLQSGNLLGGNLQTATDVGDNQDLILDDNDTALVQDGPLPLPVTMSKLDGIDPTKLVITSEPYAVAQAGWMRTARADSETCSAGEECLVTVRGLSGAVRDPETTPYVLVYADDQNYFFAEADSDGSFAANTLTLPLGETSGKTDAIFVAGMTQDDLSEGVATYPLYFVVTDTGTVEFTQTNTDGTLVTGVMASDEEGNTYYALTDNGTSDVWRQDSLGGVPVLILENASGTIIEITIIDANRILVFFEDGSAELVEIESGSAKVTPLADIFRHALAQETAGRTTADGLLIHDPVEIFDFSSYDFANASFLAYGDEGFIINIEPAEGSSTQILAAYVSLDGEDVRTLIPYDLQNSEDPLKASLSLVDGYFYVVSEMVNDNSGNPLLGDTTTEFSRIPVTADLDTTFTNAWQNREVLFNSINEETIDVDIQNGVLVYSDLTPAGSVNIYKWDESNPEELLLLWVPSDFFSELIGSNTDTSSVDVYSTTLSGGMVMAPNGEFFLACAYAEAPNGDTSDADYLDALAKGAHIFAHRIGVDDPGEFHKILDNVAVESCPDGMEITNSGLLRYFSLATDDVPSQMKFIDLHDVDVLSDYLDN